MSYIKSNRWENAYNSCSSYEWYPYAWINNIRENRIEKTKENFGTICMPTGAGKTSVIFDDIVRRINNAIKNNTKIIINLSSPLLKLNQQLSLDMMYVLLELFENITSPLYNDFSKYTLFYFNSSEYPGKAYNILKSNKYDFNNQITNNINVGEISENNFLTFDKFIKSNKNIAIICSCHKSLNIFIKYIKKYNLKNENIEIINYIDESHTINNRDFSVEDDIKININDLCIYSSAVYAISATPDIKITKIINQYSKTKKKLKDLDDPYFIHDYPADIINKGIIVPPYMDLWKTNIKEINSSIIKEIYEDSHKKNPTVCYQKILVNCPVGDDANNKKIKTLYNELCEIFKNKIADGKLRIYATSHDTKFLATTNEKFDSMKDFTSSIDNANCDCIILHIKQMIAGIDISSITQIIMFLNDINETIIRIIIQTIGRRLRSAKGERCMPFDKRTKKFGLCSFIIYEDDDETEDKLKELFIRYYTLDNYKFEKQYSSVSSSKDHIGRPLKNLAKKKIIINNIKFIILLKDFIEEYKNGLKLKLHYYNNDNSYDTIVKEMSDLFKKDNTSLIFDDRKTLDIIRQYLKDVIK